MRKPRELHHRPQNKNVVRPFALRRDILDHPDVTLRLPHILSAIDRKNIRIVLRAFEADTATGTDGLAVTNLIDPLMKP